jgi:ribose transport system substrate-binding protein
MAERKVVVALLNEHQEFQRMQAADARAAAARAHLDIDVVFAENNAVLQIHQLFKYVHAPEGERPVAIISETVTGEGLERVARNAVKAGVGWFLINRAGTYIEALREEYRQLPIGVVSVDNEEAGRIQGRQLRALLPKGGPVLYMHGPADTSAAMDRLTGAQQVIGNAGMELKVLYGDWTEESAEKAITTWLRLKTSEGFKPAVVAAQNDSMAVGARRILKQVRREWTDLKFTGCDGLPEGGQKLVGTGELTATIITPPCAGPAVNLVARGLAGERPPAFVKLPSRSFPPEDELARAAR